MLKTVVFPAPLGPIRPSSEPRCDRQVEIADSSQAAEHLAQLLNLQHRQTAVSGRACALRLVCSVWPAGRSWWLDHFSLPGYLPVDATAGAAVSLVRVAAIRGVRKNAHSTEPSSPCGRTNISKSSAIG